MHRRTSPFLWPWVALAAALAVVPAACGSTTTQPAQEGGAGGKDGSAAESAMETAAMEAASETAADGLASDAPAMATCDPGAQDCGAGKLCGLACSPPRFICAADPGGGAQTGETCSATAACAKQNVCYGVGTGFKCRKYCKTDADCPGKTCKAELLACMMGDTPAMTSLCTL